MQYLRITLPLQARPHTLLDLNSSFTTDSTWSMTLPDETSPTPDTTSTHAAAPEQPVTHSSAVQQNSPLRSAVDQKRTAGLKGLAKKEGAVAPAAKKSISYADQGVDITSGDRS